MAFRGGAFPFLVALGLPAPQSQEYPSGAGSYAGSGSQALFITSFLTHWRKHKEALLDFGLYDSQDKVIVDQLELIRRERKCRQELPFTNERKGEKSLAVLMVDEETLARGRARFRELLTWKLPRCQSVNENNLETRFSGARVSV